MANKVLISGCSGFIGKNLVSHLRPKFQLSALSRLNTPHSDIFENEFSWNNLESVREHNFYAIIHLAGKAHDLKNTSNPNEYFEVNTELTKRLFDVFLQSDASLFIYFSTVKAVADTVPDILNEDVVPRPGTVYGESKLMAEQYLLSHQLPAGKKIFILRPCMVHGPGNKGNLNLLYKFVSKGIPYPLAAFDNRRSFLSIANLEYIISRLLTDTAIPGDVYNMADDTPLSTNAVISIIGEVTGKKVKLWKFSQAFIRGMARIGDVLHLPLNSEKLKKLTESYIVSNDKLKKALQIEVLPVSSTEGLRRTIKSFSKQ